MGRSPHQRGTAVRLECFRGTAPSGPFLTGPISAIALGAERAGALRARSFRCSKGAQDVRRVEGYSNPRRLPALL